MLAQGVQSAISKEMLFPGLSWMAGILASPVRAPGLQGFGLFPDGRGIGASLTIRSEVRIPASAGFERIWL